jgi:hypothetical protein
MSAVCITIATGLCIVAVWRMRKLRGPAPNFTLWGGTPIIMISLAGLIAAAAVAILDPLRTSRGVPLEWILLVTWGGMGALLFFLRIRRGRRVDSATIN